MELFMFPGQGSQHRGMGGALFDEVAEFKALEPQIDELLGYSVRRLCLEDPDNQLGQTQYTQPALYVVNALHWFKEMQGRPMPKYLAGHSLGEYNALMAAGAFDLITGLKLVRQRGELMGQARNGGMAAVIGLPLDRLQEVLKQHGLSGLDIANLNAPSQTALSGPVDEIERAGPLLEQAGAKLVVPLPVSAAFHSRYMADAAAQFDRFLESFSFQPLTAHVLSNVTGSLHPAKEPAAVRTLLVRQITSPVQWAPGVRYLVARGASSFKEIGPGNVLTRLVQQIIDRV
jgi:trans-AT polyketide synthase/acyltransferase/oxidoreductase domain-containing protein/rhizoxin biosynthesis acyltransferase